MEVFNQERSNYYKTKKRELSRKKEESRVIQDDARFIKFYGMSAYLELFPEAKDFGINWHNEVLAELEKLEKKKLGQELSGVALAYASTKSKKSSRLFRRIIKDLTKS